VPPGPGEATAAGAIAALGRLAPGSRRDIADEGGDPLVELVAELLRFEGPVAADFPTGVLGLDDERGVAAVEALADAQRVVVDEVTRPATGMQLCDAENLERLLRIMRAGARAEIEPLPADALAPFLGVWHGLGGGAEGLEGLRSGLERLFGVVAPALAWETEILPARLDPYFPGWLDELLVSAGLVWIGCGERRVMFALEADLDLFPAARARPADLGADVAVGGEAVLPSPGRLTFEEILASTGLGSTPLSRSLWASAWAGRVSNDSFAVIRRGIEQGFEPVVSEPTRSAGTPHRRLRFGRWRASRPFEGRWFRLPEVERRRDAVDELELGKERVRILLDRHGVLFRELLEREIPALRWSRVFRTLRVMELSGEVVAGQFFAGARGPQFAAPAAVRLLRAGLADDRVWWVNAADPASPCGLAVAGLPEGLPRREASSHVVFHGRRPVVVSEAGGRRLTVNVGPDHPLLPRYLDFFATRLTRRVVPVKAVSIETINGEPAATSPFREVLAARFHVVREGTGLRLMRRY
jgi:ATP-dependent Lhr-like helicase